MEDPADGLRAALASRSALLDSSPDAIVVGDSDGLVVECNAAAEAMFGHPASLLLGAPVTLLMPERFREAYQRGMLRLAVGGSARLLGTTLELTGLRADGTEFPLELSLGGWTDQDGPRFYGIMRDVSARKLAEAALAREQALLALLEQVAGTANASETAMEALQGVLEAVCTWTGWPVGHAFLAGPDGALRSAGAWCSSDPDRYRAVEQASASIVLPPGEGLPGRVMAGGAAVEAELTPDVALPRREVLRDAGLSRAYGIPIQLGGQVVGALEFFLPPEGQAAADLLEVMGNITAQIGRVIERERALHRLSQQEARFRALVEHAADVVVVLDSAGALTYVSAGSVAVFGWAPGQIVGRRAGEFLHPDDLERARRWRQAAADTPGRAPTAEMRVRCADGSWGEVEVVANNRLRDPHVAGIVVHLRDLSSRRQMEQELAYARLHDPVTRLPNRLLFEESVEHALERAQRSGWSAAVLAVDLDDFGSLNERLGMAAGDRILRTAAERLQAAVRPYDAVTRPFDTVARAGNDEFLVLCENVDGPAAAAAIAKRLLGALGAPSTDGQDEVALTAAIGIAVVGSDATHPHAVIGNAQAALRRARSAGRASYVFFDEEVRAEEQERAALHRDLEQAVERGQLVLHYQPKVLVASGRIIGAEALVRWQHPERGLVPPLDFIPLAEQTGLIEPIGTWVLREACREAVGWCARFPATPLPLVCVNVSPRQFRAELVETVERALADSGLPATSLCLEVTESVVMDDVERAIHVLQGIKSLGVLVSVDDFGTGYSSLAYLKRLPLDELKIDRSFVDGLGSEPEDTAITAAVTAMAHALGLLVVAEGVETPLQLERLRAMGCDIAQGYHFSRPVPAPAMTQLLAEDQDRHAGTRERHVLSVVVADDAPEVRQLAAVSLSTAGFEVHEATDGRQALELVGRLRPDCLLLDVQMPYLTGFEVCRRASRPRARLVRRRAADRQRGRAGQGRGLLGRGR